MAKRTNTMLFKIIIFTLLIVACNTTNKEGNDYEIAHPVYITLAQKSLDYLTNFELENFAEMLSDSIIYELPNGKKIIGKIALINYWKKYKNLAKIQSMKITNANYLPVDSHIKSKKSLGIKVVVDFTNDIIFKYKKMSVKMNFSFHFNKQKLIDRIDSNYDQSFMAKALGENNSKKKIKEFTK